MTDNIYVTVFFLLILTTSWCYSRIQKKKITFQESSHKQHILNLEKEHKVTSDQLENLKSELEKIKVDGENNLRAKKEKIQALEDELVLIVWTLILVLKKQCFLVNEFFAWFAFSKFSGRKIQSSGRDRESKRKGNKTNPRNPEWRDAETASWEGETFPVFSSLYLVPILRAKLLSNLEILCAELFCMTSTNHKYYSGLFNLRRFHKTRPIGTRNTIISSYL